MFQLEGNCQDSIYVKKSFFLTYAFHVQNVEQALDYLIKNKSRKSSHNCWAYNINGIVRFFDDNEPYGTAGKQILNAILKHEFDYILILVSRWFGGIKLGINRLSRIYFKCASDCLERGIKKPIVPSNIFELDIDLSIFNYCFYWFNKYNIDILNKKFCKKNVKIQIKVTESILGKFDEFVKKNQIKSYSKIN